MQSILVIEDQAEMRTVVQAVLSEAGYQVTMVTNSAEAMKALTKLTPDIILTDVIMPGKDGLETLLEVHKSHPRTPVIVMTGGGQLTAEYYLNMARLLGAKGVLQKPFSPQQLTMTVALALSPARA